MKNILFYSFKGGVGRSSTLCNVAASLCRKNYTVGILDFDVEAPSIHIIMESAFPKQLLIEDHTPDILTLLRNDIDNLTPLGVKEATIPLILPWEDTGCDIIPCFGRERDWKELIGKYMEKSFALKKILEMFTNNSKLDFLLIDGQSGLTQQTVAAALPCDDVVVVTKPDNVSLPGMKNMLKMFEHGTKKIHLILTSVPKDIKPDNIKIKNFMKVLDCNIEVDFIPYNPKWYFGVEVMWEKTKKNSTLIEPFDYLVERLVKED